MGIIKQGILGGFSGKVGSVIGGTWKGIDYVRSTATSVSNPQTTAQLNQRQRFSIVMGFLQPFTEFLKTGYRSFNVKMSQINAAMSYNIRNAIAGVYPNYDIDYPNALVARGKLATALNPAAASTVASTVNFTWDNNSDEMGANASDKTLLVVYNPVKHQVISANQLAQRSTGTQNLTVPDSFTGDTVHCYMAYINLDGIVSNSHYAGSVIVA